MLELIGSLTLFFLLSLGLGWALAARLPLPPAGHLLVAGLASLLLLWLAGWTIYLSGLPWTAAWCLPPAALAGLWWRRRELAELFRNAEARECLFGVACLAFWNIGWQALVQSYSGGGWSGDWFEHWQRALFFLNRGPADELFLGFYPLTARPPLANVLMAVWLELSRPEFYCYQLFSTLSSTLVFLPAALLALRWRRHPSTVTVLTLLLMANPLFVQNAVFPWTKLPAAFFVLSALYFFLLRRDGDASLRTAAFFSLALAGGLLTHYSAAPYAVALGLAWWCWRPAGVTRLAFMRVTAGAAGLGTLLLVTWFGWAFSTYGFTGTVATNTAVTTVAKDVTDQLGRMLLNLRDTLVPHFLRSPDPALIAQSSPWGYARDWFFQSYQLNLFLVLGSVAWLAVLWEGRKLWRTAVASVRWFWAGFCGLVILLGIISHGARDEWGLTHICLQALVILGIAFLASRWEELGDGWRRFLVGGLTFDLICGIALHFAVQNFAFDRWLTPTRDAMTVFSSYNPQVLQNALGLARNQLDPIYLVYGSHLPLVLALLGSTLSIALWRSKAAVEP